jgi:hypothetical protein
VADPDRMPTFLLLVGGPDEIPFEFQYQLDVSYAAGRIAFETVEAYAAYARGVVATESVPVELPPRVGLFAPRNPEHRAAALINDALIGPLAERLRADRCWEVELTQAEDATRTRLRQVFADSPALLLTAGSGISFPLDDPRQLTDQGGIVCQEWPGPWAWRKEFPPEFYFTTADVPAEARLLGSVAFLLNDFSVGCPKLEDFPRGVGERRTLAARPFISRLPQRLLTHPNGGLLAVIGKVERAWTMTFYTPAGGREPSVLVNTCLRLLSGAPVGTALEFLNDRYAEQAALLAAEIEDRPRGLSEDSSLQKRLIELKDTRNFVLFGDPAVRLRFGNRAGPGDRRPVLGELVPQGERL